MKVKLEGRRNERALWVLQRSEMHEERKRERKKERKKRQERKIEYRTGK